MKKEPAKRITAKYIESFINEKLKAFDMAEFTVLEVRRTRYRGQDYEAGAASLNIWCQCNGSRSLDLVIYCFVPMHELQRRIKEGYILKLGHEQRSNDWELKLSKY